MEAITDAIYGFATPMLIVGVAALLIMLLASGITGIFSSKPPYAPKDKFFTPAERNFLGVLDRAVGNRGRVFGQVRIADVITVKKGLSRSDRTTAQNKINSKHLDYIICCPDSMKILCAVELNDKSHQRAERRARDVFVENALEAAGTPLIWVKAKRQYDVAEVAAQIRPHLI